jgi:hypothetical protein
LVRLDYDKEFLIFYFSFNNTIATILLKNNIEGHEKLIAFFSKALRDVELKYDIMEKQEYSLVKALKYFREFVLHSKVLVYVPTSVVKDILV